MYSKKEGSNPKYFPLQHVDVIAISTSCPTTEQKFIVQEEDKP
jgi:hypothetical protein